MTFGIATGALPERDDWPAALARAEGEGWPYLELTAGTEQQLRALLRHLAGGRLGSFERVSVHAPLSFDTSVTDIQPILEGIEHDLVLHPDVYRDEAWVVGLGSRAVFENMDVAKSFGRTAADLKVVFERFPEAGFCLDVAHVRTNDESLALGHELLDAFGGRLRQLHVSGIEPDGTHRLTTEADLALYEPLLRRAEHVPWLLEAELEAPTVR